MMDRHTAHNEEPLKRQTWVKNTQLFRDWERTKQEILKHKWLESEKAGHDIGWDRAALDWMIRHGKKNS